MKRYYNDEPNDFFEDSEEDDFDDDILSHMIIEEDGSLFGAWESSLLTSAISFLSLSFFWRFKNYKTRLKELKEVYTTFYELTDPVQKKE